MIAGLFGVAWTEWATSGISGAASESVRGTGIVVGLVIFFWSARLWWSATRERGSASVAPPRKRSRSMFSSPAFWLVVALEVVAIRGGTALLGVTGNRDYAIAWVAIVVGMHFLAFGRLFWAGAYRLGAALIAAGMAGAMVGFAGGGVGGIKATSGLLAAASLYVAGGWTLRDASRPPPRAVSPSLSRGR